MPVKVLLLVMRVKCCISDGCIYVLPVSDAWLYAGAEGFACRDVLEAQAEHGVSVPAIFEPVLPWRAFCKRVRSGVDSRCRLCVFRRGKAGWCFRFAGDAVAICKSRKSGREADSDGCQKLPFSDYRGGQQADRGMSRACRECRAVFGIACGFSPPLQVSRGSATVLPAILPARARSWSVYTSRKFITWRKASFNYYMPLAQAFFGRRAYSAFRCGQQRSRPWQVRPGQPFCSQSCRARLPGQARRGIFEIGAAALCRLQPMPPLRRHAASMATIGFIGRDLEYAGANTWYSARREWLSRRFRCPCSVGFLMLRQPAPVFRRGSLFAFFRWPMRQESRACCAYESAGISRQCAWQAMDAHCGRAGWKEAWCFWRRLAAGLARSVVLLLLPAGEGAIYRMRSTFASGLPMWRRRICRAGCGQRCGLFQHRMRALCSRISLPRA